MVMYNYLVRHMISSIATSDMTPTFNMADVNVQERDSLMATPTLKSNAGDQKVYKKESIMVVWCG